ncbi:MAG: hypothetical protein NVS2B17_01290 [Candidatus Velthaea sp.]
MEPSVDPFDVAKGVVESVVLETARRRRRAEVYIIDRHLDVAFTNSSAAALPWWSRSIVRALIADGRVAEAFTAGRPRVVGVRAFSSERFVVTIEETRP